MVLRHASEKFRHAYELPIEKYELFGEFHQFSNTSVESLDENSYRSDILAKYDLWRKKKDDQLMDYQNLNESFYDIDMDETEIPEYNDDDSQSALNYQWHRDRHFDLKNVITKYVDDKL
jgi:hypothetical protein